MLLKSKSFFSFVVVFCTTAINDNIFKSALLILLALLVVNNAPALSFWSNLVAMLFVLPYVLFSGIAAAWADYFTRYRVCLAIKWIEIFLVLLISVSIYLENLYFLAICVFLLGTQSAVFAPSKYSYIPDLIRNAKIDVNYRQTSIANAILESGTFASILVGSIIGSLVVGHSENYIVILFLIMLFCACSGLVACFNLPKSKAKLMDKPQLRHCFTSNFQIISRSMKDSKTRYLILANCLFWFFGSSQLVQIPILIVDYLQWEVVYASYAFISFAMGIFIASVLMSYFSRGESSRVVAKKLILFNLLVMALLTITMSLLIDPVVAIKPWQLLTILVAIAISSGLFIIPLFSLLHMHSTEDNINAHFASNNLLGAIFMIGASILAWLVLTLWSADMKTYYIILGSVMLVCWVYLQSKKQFFS